jgi:hypothetical protein
MVFIFLLFFVLIQKNDGLAYGHKNCVFYISKKDK